ncbi:MAG TPA: DUF4833 domain-containing protein [Bacteroidia bacterium]|nr:DUF4833 domain-containing protein [Bacteroidia bacterium]
MMKNFISVFICTLNRFSTQPTVVNLRFLLCLFGLLVIKTSVLAIPSDYKNKSLTEFYPVPPQNDRSLFYIQRSKNTNAIVYETNILPSGKINTEEPLKIYWMQYASDSSVAELNYVQKRYAYGIRATPVKGHPGEFVLNFVSYEKKKFYLILDPGGKQYKTYTTINGKMAELKKIFIHLEGGSFWFPNIVDIEITGKDPATLQKITEHFKP